MALPELPSTGAASTGDGGALERTVKPFTFESIEALPAASVATADAVWEPAARATEGVKVHAPEPSVVAAPAEEPSTKTVTVLLA